VAKPWTPITDEYLSSKEFLLLLGLNPKATDYRYRKLLHFCEIAAHPDSNHDLFPGRLRDCFMDRTVNILAFKGHYGDATRAKVEYRIAIADLAKDCQVRALDIVLKRVAESTKLTESTRLGLRTLAYENNQSISQVINDLIKKAVVEKVRGQSG